MDLNKAIWVLRVAIFGEFLGHGMFALSGKEAWLRWLEKLLGVSPETASILLTLIGLMDILLAILVLLKPIRILLLWMAIWGFWTAILRPIVGEPVLDFVERWSNWGAPLALLFLLGWPKEKKEWFR